MDWGKGIFASFIVFATVISTMVFFCFTDHDSLVTENYYQEELDYGQQMERKRNVAAMDVKPVIELTGQRFVEVRFPEGTQVDQCNLELLRPSNKSLDQSFDLSSKGSIQKVEIRFPEKGMYRARLTWTVANKGYYMEEIIVL